MSDSGKAVFLSYASQDAEAAKRICDALRQAGVEVWFDQSELVGGDAWDAKIRGQISSCALFIPVISASTQARLEGYFRREWKQAAARTHDMADEKAFLLPVVIDDTKDTAAKVPAEFKAVQWTKLPGGETPAGFVTRVKRLLSGEQGAGSGETATPDPRPLTNSRRLSRLWWALPIFGVTMALLLVLKERRRDAPVAGPTVAAGVPAPSSADALVVQARALLDDDPLMTRANVELAEQLGLQALAKEPMNAEANALVAWANFHFLLENYDHSPQRAVDLKKYADKALLLAPNSVHAELAACGVLMVTREYEEAFRRLQALADRAPGDLTVLRTWAWATAWGRGPSWGVGQEGEHPAMARLRAVSPLGRAYADTLAAGRAWGRGNYAEADRLVDGVFASGHPVRLTYLVRLLVLTFGWGDLPAAREFAKTIPAKLLLEDVFINHVSTLWLYSGENDQALAILDRASRPLLHEARVVTPTAELRGRALAAAGRTASAAIQWNEALKVVGQELEQEQDNDDLRASKVVALARLGDLAAARREFALVEELRKATRGSLQWGIDFDLATETGDVEGAIARLDRAIAADNPRWPNTYTQVRYDPLFGKLRADPRVQLIMARAEKWIAEMRARAPAAEARGGETAAAAPDKSVAVLAFADLSEKHDSEYFSDGISEELLNVLAKVPGLKVSARTSAFYFKGKEVPMPEIAKQLGVAYIVEGSVRKQGDKVRITAQLSKAADGFQVWNDTFTRDLKDVFAVQDEIAGLIAKNLSVRMGVSMRAEHQVNPDALAVLLEGRHYWALRTTEGFARAEALFNRAVTLDPQWAPAHAALASLLAIQASYQLGGGEAASDRFEQATREARRAIELDATLGEPQATLGKIAMENRWLAESEDHFRQALALEPNNALIHDWYGDLAVLQGRLDVATAEYRRALELDPLSPYIQWDLAWELMHVRRYAEALPLLEQAAGLTPTGAPRLILRRARVLLELGRKAEAETVLRQYLDGFTAETDRQMANEAIWCLRALGWQAEAERRAADQLRQNPDSYSSGAILVMLGQLDRAYPLLEKTPPIFMQQIYWDPVFDPLRDTPRFQQLLVKLNCVEEYKVARATQARLLREQEMKK